MTETIVELALCVLNALALWEKRQKKPVKRTRKPKQSWTETLQP